MKTVGGQSYKPVMLWAAATNNFFSFCRSGEITVPSENSYNVDSHLSFEDLKQTIPLIQVQSPYASNTQKQIKGARK